MKYTKKLIRMAGAQPILHIRAPHIEPSEAAKIIEGLKNIYSGTMYSSVPIIVSANKDTEIEYIRFVSPKRNRFLHWRKSHKK